MTHITITINVTARERDDHRLALADRYVERARQSIDTRQRDAYFDEADRIYRDEGVSNV